MATEFILAPVAHAVNPLELINAAGQIINSQQQAIQAQREAQANQQLVAQMTAPGEDKYFKSAIFARIPGFYQYLGQSGLNPNALNCTTLPTTLTEVRSEVCRIGVTNDRGVAPQAQLSEMFSLYKTYGDVSKAYESYSSISNAEGQGFGVGCMNNALQTLSGYLAAKISNLDDLMTKVTFINDKFKEASKIDLDAIAESTAVLDGGSSELANEVKTRRPDLFDFGKRFDNPACKSMYAGDGINTIGRGNPGGLNQISKRMKDEYSSKPAGSKFSAETYTTGHASVVADINKMADKAAQQFNLNFSSYASDNGYGNFLRDIPSNVSSTNGLTSLLRGDFFSDAQQSFNKEMADISANRQLLTDALGGVSGAERALASASNLNSKSFDNDVAFVQNQIRNNCLQRSFGGGDFWENIKRNIKDPSNSKFANKNGFNPIRERIQSIMTDPRTTPEAKIEALRAIEQSEGGRFVLSMQGSYQKTTLVNGKNVTTTVNPSGSAPSSYFNDVVQTCDAQFNTNKLGSTMTGAGAVQTLRLLNEQYKRLAANQSNKIRSEIRRKLIECENPGEANSPQAGACTSAKFNTGAAGFCANAAFTCANNMKSCTAQAEKFVTTIKNERTARVQKYKQNMEANKNQIKGMVAALFQENLELGRGLAALNLGATFNSPMPDLNISGEYLDKFQNATRSSPDGALLLEDPDKYVDIMKRNIDGLKRSLQKLQTDLTGRGGLLAQHIEQTKRNYQTAKAKADEISNSCIAKHDDYIRQSEQQRAQQLAEMQKRMNELGERRQDFCNRYGMLDTNPNGACNGNIGDLTAAARAAGDLDAVDRFNRVCARTNNNQSGTSSYSAGVLCNQARNENSRIITSPELRSQLIGSDGQSGLCKAIDDANAACESSSTPQPEGSSTERVSGACSNITRRESAVVTAYDSWKLDNEPGLEVGAAESAPVSCTAGFNGDRNTPENNSLMGANPLQAAMNVFGQ